MASSIKEGFRCRDEEEICAKDFVRFAEPFLCFFEVEINVECFDEASDRILVLVLLLADDSHEIFELLLVIRVIVTVVTTLGTRPIAIRNHSGGKVAQDPGTGGLNGVDVGWAEEHFGKFVSGLFVVEEGE